MKNLCRFLIIALIAGCVEPYQFRIADGDPGIVVEATLSDRSFAETLDYPSDGRYFTVRLSRTSDVINVRSQTISSATVTLQANDGGAWTYTENTKQPGLYELLDNDFRAVEGVQYRLSVVAPGDITIQSDWQSLPAAAPPIGAVGFKESSIPRIIMEKVRDIRGVIPFISVPQNESGKTLYYRWKLHPTWVFVAPLAETYSPVRTCWVTSNYYIRDYVVQADNAGGYAKDLSFIEIESNEKILEEFSLLVEQQVMSEDYYNFWNEMQGLNQPDGVFATPPFNLKSNFTASSGQVYGYFGVVREQATRWYFNINDLSYRFVNWFPEQCATPCGVGCPPPECVSCLRYEGGKPTNVRPVWWGR